MRILSDSNDGMFWYFESMIKHTRTVSYSYIKPKIVDIIKINLMIAWCSAHVCSCQPIWLIITVNNCAPCKSFSILYLVIVNLHHRDICIVQTFEDRLSYQWHQACIETISQSLCYHKIQVIPVCQGSNEYCVADVWNQSLCGHLCSKLQPASFKWKATVNTMQKSIVNHYLIPFQANLVVWWSSAFFKTIFRYMSASHFR